jgi:tRNA modification GTPase
LNSLINDTIAAIATPLGEGGLAVIRISGPRALAVAEGCFRPRGKPRIKLSAAPTHTLHYGTIERAGSILDEVLVAVMRSPRTYTREDVVEISCHGGLLPAKLVLDAVLAQGARLAEPGEFTKRAFLNGRLDLAQAEAVADLIHSQTELALSAAHEQLAGNLSRRINQLRDDMMITLAHVEAHIDFPDEDIAPATLGKLMARLEDGLAFMDQLLASAREGQLLRRGIRAALVGRPNAGKSSLLNLLLGHDRAIVSALPGTTRDTIEETANIRGLPVVLVDTAGLRQAGDAIEMEGVRRSRDALARAELILRVLDASEPFSPEDNAQLREPARQKRILILNKADLPPRLSLPPDLDLPSLSLSCRTGQGLEDLKDAIRDAVWSGKIKAEMFQVMINSRHEEALRRAREALIRCLEALRMDQTLELAAFDLRQSVLAVGEIVGKTTTEDLLDSIFSQFCLGK